MKIRSLTYFTNPGRSIYQDVIDEAAAFITTARAAFVAAGFEVQTARLATPPFPRLLPDTPPEAVVAFARELETSVNQAGYDYLSIGPAIPEQPASYAVIPAVIAGTNNTFAAGVMASSQAGISLPAVKACAGVIQQLSSQEANGFANLYFAALANVPPGAPFFPAAYHGGGSPVFAIATEAADLAVTTFSQAATLREARSALTGSIESAAEKMSSIATAVIHEMGDAPTIRFGGIDFSLAPFPEIPLSLGTAMERLGVPGVGQHGSLAAAALIADIIDKAGFSHTGFSGMMLPVLEDAILAARAAEGLLTIKDLLLYSAVCGTGLDTVPLPGEVDSAQLVGLLLDLSALAIRLNKPLTARLMPIPGAKAGDSTDFDFPYFANSRVMALDSQPLVGLFAGDEDFPLNTRSQGDLIDPS